MQVTFEKLFCIFTIVKGNANTCIIYDVTWRGKYNDINKSETIVFIKSIRVDVLFKRIS